MKVFQAICLKDYSIEGITDEKQLETVTLKRGKEYTVSHKHDDGTRTVFTNYWFRAPDDIFGGVEPL